MVAEGTGSRHPVRQDLPHKLIVDRVKAFRWQGVRWIQEGNIVASTAKVVFVLEDNQATEARGSHDMHESSGVARKLREQIHDFSGRLSTR